MRIVTLTRSVALALAVALAAGCDAGPDDGDPADASGADAVDTGAPPVTVPPPVAGPDTDPGPDGTPGPLPIPAPDTDPGDDDDDDDSDDQDGDAAVPSRFQGSYAADQAACDAPGNPTQLTIDEDSISFHESTGPVTEVSSSPSEVTITAELTGEGETREATYRFRLSDDGRTLTDQDGGMERVRCN